MKLSKRGKKTTIDRRDQQGQGTNSALNSFNCCVGPSLCGPQDSSTLPCQVCSGNLGRGSHAAIHLFTTPGPGCLSIPPKDCVFQVDEVQCLIEVDLKCRTHNASDDNNRNKQENELSVLSLSLSILDTSPAALN